MTGKATILEDRGLIVLTGLETAGFLQGLLTQDIEGLIAGEIAYGTLLTPQGKIISDFFIGRSEIGFTLDCPLDMVPTLIKKLSLYKLRAAIGISDLTESYVTAIAWELDAMPSGWLRDPRLGGLGFRSYAPRAEMENQIAAYEQPTDSVTTYRSLLLDAGVPEFGFGYDTESVFPMDVNLDALNGIDYRKGCFVGQEVTSRMKRKGEIRKRTWRVLFEKSAPAPGTEIMAGETTIGTLTACHGRQGLAIVRLDRLERAETGGYVAGDQPCFLEEPAYLKETD